MRTKREKRSTVSRKTAPRRIADQDLRGASGGASLNYGKIEWTYTKQKPDGTDAGHVSGGWDLNANKGV